MNWYRIPLCPNYAISEDGQQVKNITTDFILKHDSNSRSNDGMRRVSLRRTVVYRNKVCRRVKVYKIEELKVFIKEENKL